MMEWLILIGVIVVLLPFYVYILSKSATLGKINVYRKMTKPNEEKSNGKEQED